MSVKYCCPRNHQRYTDIDCNCQSDIAKTIREITNSPCDWQDESPLFSVLPGEIRNEIYSLALAEQDSTIPFDRHHAAYRPDYPNYRYIDTALLRTCKRMYQETHQILQNSVSVLRFWLGSPTRQPTLISKSCFYSLRCMWLIR
jgi:hypothetical protein